MAEPNNILLGDTSEFDEPQPEPEGVIDEKKMASFTNSDEFKRIQAHCAERITFYQTHLPNGAEVGLDVVPSLEDWRVANRVIGELRLLMNIYTVTTEAVENAA